MEVWVLVLTFDNLYYFLKIISSVYILYTDFGVDKYARYRLIFYIAFVNWVYVFFMSIYFLFVLYTFWIFFFWEFEVTSRIVFAKLIYGPPYNMNLFSLVVTLLRTLEIELDI